MTAKGRLLGVDFGTVRIGLAITDPERIIASPLAVYRRRNPASDAEYFRRLAAAEEVAGLVVGLPVHMSGDEGQKAREARALGEWLASLTGLPVVYWDERFSTQDADAHLQGAGLSRARRQQRLDKVAAQVILQSYLDASREAQNRKGAERNED